ncbi:MAG: sulfurtransferase TusA family protein [Elioraea sp.]|nr:sulfurtransferase TusA family protein [Elioraea sp.]
MSEQNHEGTFFLDITGETCPMTFVRTRLMLDRLPTGSRLTVRLTGKEPLESVPRSAAGLGHLVLAIEPEVPGRTAPSDVWLVSLRKGG